MIKSWMIIGAVTFLVAFGSGVIKPKDIKWFARLRRPSWLTFEALIPIIWTIVFICGAWSAYIVWERTQSWALMAFYLLVEVTIVLYSPVMLWTRRLNFGTFIGGLGFVLGLILTFFIMKESSNAALLLVPYLLWSPIGTYTTWEMAKLNPESA